MSNHIWNISTYLSIQICIHTLYLLSVFTKVKHILKFEFHLKLLYKCYSFWFTITGNFYMFRILHFRSDKTHILFQLAFVCIKSLKIFFQVILDLSCINVMCSCPTIEYLTYNCFDSFNFLTPASSV